MAKLQVRRSNQPRIATYDPFEEELRQRMAMARKQGWKENEVKASAAVARRENIMQRLAERQQEASPQASGPTTPERKSNPWLDIGLPLLGGTAAVALAPFTGGSSLALLAGLGAAGSAGGKALANKLQDKKLSEGVLGEAAFGALGGGAKALKAARVARLGSRVDDVAKGTKTATTATKVGRGGSIARTSTIGRASDQNKLVNTARQFGELRGSGAKKFQNVEGVIENLTDSVDEQLAKIPRKVPVNQFNQQVSALHDAMPDDLEKREFNRLLGNIYKSVGNPKDVSELTGTQLNAMRRVVNRESSNLFRKVANGQALTAAERAKLDVRELLSGMIDEIAPEDVRRVNGQISTLINGIPEFKKLSEQGLQVGSMRLPFGRPVQSAQDLAGRAVANATGQGAARAPGLGYTAGAQAVPRALDILNAFGGNPQQASNGMQITPTGAIEGEVLPGTAGGIDPANYGVENDPLFAQLQELESANYGEFDPFGAAEMGAEGDQAQGGSILDPAAIEQMIAQAFTPGISLKDQAALLGNVKDMVALREALYPEQKDQDLSANQQKDLSKINTAENLTAQYENLLSSMGGNQGGLLGRASGAARSLAGRVGLDDEAELYNTQRKGTVAMLAKSLGEVGTLTDADKKAAMELIPKLGDSPQLQAAKIQQLRAILQQNKQSIMSLPASSGFDFGSFGQQQVMDPFSYGL